MQIDTQGERLGRRTKVDYRFLGDTNATLTALLQKLNQNSNDKDLKGSLERYETDAEGVG